MHEIVYMEMLRIIEHVVQVRGLHTGLEVNVPTLRIVVVSAVASNAGHHALMLVRVKDVCLRGGRVGAHCGCVVPAVRFLVAVRLGFSAMSLGILLRLGVRAAVVPIRLLVNLIAGVDMDVVTFRLVGRLELETWAVADAARVNAISTVSGAIVAGRNILECDRVGRKRCFRHVTRHGDSPWVGVHTVRPNLDGPNLVLRTVFGQDAKTDAIPSERITFYRSSKARRFSTTIASRTSARTLIRRSMEHRCLLLALPLPQPAQLFGPRYPLAVLEAQFGEGRRIT